MLFKQNNPSGIREVILTSLLTLLTGCGDSAALEGLVSADPKLKVNQTQQSQKTSLANPQAAQDSSSGNNQDSSTSNLSNKTKSTSDNDTNDNLVAKNQPASNQSSSQQPHPVDDLIINFPNSIPIYPQAELQESDSNQDRNSGTLIWQTNDNRQAVANFYQAELIANEWEIVKPFNINPQHPQIRAIAIKEDLQIELTIVRSTTEQDPQPGVTEVTVAYQASLPEDSTSTRQLDKAIDVDAASEPNAPTPELSAQLPSESTTPESLNPTTATDNSDNYFDSTDGDFADLDEVPEPLQEPLASVAALEILTPYTGKANVELTKFAPNEIITRGEYARWLLAANNRYHEGNLGKKIYIAAKTNQPAFKDVKQQHPDFEAIQSLAEAGLIPSRLTEDSNNLMFQPNAPLTREDLILWKVPLDTRQALPKASLEAIEDTWGFKDAANIDSAAIRALYADFQNGDLANIRRIFGYTTLFQPKKPVTRAEAAASLSYFGYQGDGINAKEVLSAETETEPES